MKNKNNSKPKQKFKTKKRKAWISAFLSLLSSGLGQIYNGEFLKGEQAYSGFSRKTLI